MRSDLSAKLLRAIGKQDHPICYLAYFAPLHFPSNTFSFHDIAECLVYIHEACVTVNV